jgi:hypothetical protein
MTTVSGPTRRSHRAKAPTSSRKRCLNATVQAADDLDDWIRRYRMNRSPRNRAVFVRDRSVWLSIGHCLKVQYDALAAPVPPQIARLVEQLDTQK